MSENVLSAVLTLSLLAGGTVAFGSEMLEQKQAAVVRHTATLGPVTVVGRCTTATLPQVTVIGQRVAATERVTLPTVVVTGVRRAQGAAQTEVAAATSGIEQRVQ